MRKPRSDSKLYRLSPGERTVLIGLLRENLRYTEVVQLLRERLGVRTSEAAVGVFYSRNMEAILKTFAPVPSAGISVTVKSGSHAGELVLTFDAPPSELTGTNPGHEVGSVPATARSAGVRVVALTDPLQSQIRLTAYPIPLEDVPPAA